MEKDGRILRLFVLSFRDEEMFINLIITTIERFVGSVAIYTAVWRDMETKEKKFNVHNIANRLKDEFFEFRLLLKSVPTLLVALFVISVFSMNLLANKSINLPVDWLALDCGICVSWFAFLAMDILTKRFGPKAATQLSLLAICVNLVLCLVFFIGSKIPGMWGESFVEGSEGTINTALDNTFGGTWYVLLGSTFAFIVSAVVNNFSNWGIGKLFKKNPNGAGAYILRTYVSTAIGQFVDNLTFALVVSHFFFGWTIVQCITCAITGMLVELACEAIFTYPGFKICKKWEQNGVGAEYLQYVASKAESNLDKDAESNIENNAENETENDIENDMENNTESNADKSIENGAE